MFSTRQLAFGIATFIGGSSLFTIFITQITFQDSWFSVLLSLLLSLAVFWIYACLMHRFPQRGLLEMHLAVYGKALGRVMNFAYTLFCVCATALSLRNLGDFFTGYIMTEMPLWFMLFAVSLTCALTALGGIRSILRTAFPFFVFLLVALLTNSLLLLPNMSTYNFLPMFRLGWKAYAHAGFVLAGAPFCESMVFLILLPYAAPDVNPRKSFFTGLLLGSLFFLITMCRDIASLGTALTFLAEPTYESVRLINLMDVFSRLEILFAFSLIIMRVFKLSILFCATLRGIEDTTGRPPFRKGLWLFGIAIVTTALSFYAFRSGIALPEWFRSVGAWFFVLFEMAFPLLTLLVSLLRGVRQKNS